MEPSITMYIKQCIIDYLKKKGKPYDDRKIEIISKIITFTMGALGFLVIIILMFILETWFLTGQIRILP